MSELLPRHHALLEVESAIAPDVIAERGYFSATTKAQLGELGFGRSLQRVPSLVIPVHGVVKGEPPWYMHRPDSPLVRDGKTRKYLIARGQRMALDVHPRVHGGRRTRTEAPTPAKAQEGSLTWRTCAREQRRVWSGCGWQGGWLPRPDPTS